MFYYTNMVYSSVPEVFGARLRHARGDLSQEKLAEILGVVPLTVSRWERGVRFPSPEQLQDIATRLRRPLSWFFEDDNVELTERSQPINSTEALSVLTNFIKANDEEASQLRRELVDLRRSLREARSEIERLYERNSGEVFSRVAEVDTSHYMRRRFRDNKNKDHGHKETS